MCNRAGIVVTQDAKVYDLPGVSDHHSIICAVYGLKIDETDRYEWHAEGKWRGMTLIKAAKPFDFDWTGDGWTDYLTVDYEAFVPKASHMNALKSHLKRRFPDREAWDATETPDESLDMREIVLDGQDTLLLVCGEHEGIDYAGDILAFGGSTNTGCHAGEDYLAYSGSDNTRCQAGRDYLAYSGSDNTRCQAEGDYIADSGSDNTDCRAERDYWAYGTNTECQAGRDYRAWINGRWAANPKSQTGGHCESR